jgi:hypothetical protein
VPFVLEKWILPPHIPLSLPYDDACLNMVHPTTISFYPSRAIGHPYDPKEEGDLCEFAL